MARNFDPFELDSDWTLISDGAISAISFQVQRATAEIRVTATDQEPAASAHGWSYSASTRDGEMNRSLTDMAGVISTTGYVWARGAGALIVVDHA